MVCITYRSLVIINTIRCLLIHTICKIHLPKLLYKAKAATPNAAATKPADPTIVGAAPAADDAADPADDPAEAAPPVALDKRLESLSLPVAVPELVIVPELPVLVEDEVPVADSDVVVVGDPDVLDLAVSEERSERRDELRDEPREAVRLPKKPSEVVLWLTATCAERRRVRKVEVKATMFAIWTG